MIISKVLLKPHENECQISGIAYHNDYDATDELEVSWNSEEGRIDNLYRMDLQQYRFVLPAVHVPSYEPTDQELLGYLVHVPCWEMLCHHRVLGTMVKTDFKTILDILCRKCRGWGYGTDISEADRTFMSTKGKGFQRPL